MTTCFSRALREKRLRLVQHAASVVDHLLGLLHQRPGSLDRLFGTLDHGFQAALIAARSSVRHTM